MAKNGRTGGTTCSRRQPGNQRSTQQIEAPRQALERGLHLDYRRLRGKARTWNVRHYLGDQRYEIKQIGIADDPSDADGDLVQQPRVRTKKGAEQNYREAAGDAEYHRKRRNTANRYWAWLRRALNQALAAGKINSAAWRHIKPFAKANAPRVHYLTVAEDSAKQFLTLLGVGPLPQAPTSRRLRKLTGFLGARCSARRRSSKILAMKDGPMKECQRTWRWHLPQAGETASSLLPPSPPAEKATAANNRPGRPAPEGGRGRVRPISHCSA